jgi:hypothetical protein
MSGPNVRSFQFSEPERDLEFLASLHLLVSTRPNTPVVCLQHAVPVISLCGEKKTGLLFENLGLRRLCYGNRRVHEFLGLMRSRPALDRFVRDFRFPDVAALGRDSGAHLETLSDRLADLNK